MDEDLAGMTRDQLLAEVQRLRAGIRAHRDSTGHDLCWHHPQLWGLLPEPIPRDIAVPAWPQFLRGCISYRQSLDRELPDAPRTDTEFSAPPSPGRGAKTSRDPREADRFQGALLAVWVTVAVGARKALRPEVGCSAATARLGASR
jgi:hypothetical protein